jgi:hypothetical protein
LSLTSNIGLDLFYFEFSSTKSWWRAHAYGLPETQAAMIAVEGDTASNHINVEEVQAIFEAFLLFVHQWQGYEAVPHTDSTTTYFSLRKGYINGAADAPLKQLLLRIAALDIGLLPAWLSSCTRRRRVPPRS